MWFFLFEMFLCTLFEVCVHHHLPLCSVQVAIFSGFARNVCFAFVVHRWPLFGAFVWLGLGFFLASVRHF